MAFWQDIILIAELVGTVAFAIAGALIGIEKEFDIFGVVVLGCTTATGGGVIRDILLGITPPVMFENYIYAAVACAVSLLVFAVAYIGKGKVLNTRGYMTVIDVFDAVGLGIFTVMGVNAAINTGYTDNGFLAVFVGTMTGVGGGALRDVLARSVPFIFVRRIYAIASIAGAVLYFEMCSVGVGVNISMLAGSLLIILIRILAMVFKWKLPRVRHRDTVAAGEKK